MNTQVAANHLTLTLTHQYSAPIEKVFQAWTNPEMISKWFAPSDDFTVNVPLLELKTGGQYRIEMTNSQNETYTAIGEYVEILQPERLVFTWAWENGDSGMLVTIQLKEKGAATELTLIHEQLPDQKTLDNHEDGWEGCLGRLQRLLT